MPKIKPTVIEQKQRSVRSIILAKMELHNISEQEVAVRAGMAARTFRDKKKKPETFKMGELWDVCRVLKISDGACGAVMVSAIKAFQTAHNLTVDGVTGANTWYAIFN